MRDILLARGDDNNTPLYLQLARNLRHHIAGGGIDPGNALPSERELTEMTGLSRVTVRKSINQLIEEGILVRKQGSGTFVARRIETPGSVLSSFTDDAHSRGENPGVIWMIKAYAQPTEEEAAMLRIAPSTRVARLGRVRVSNRSAIRSTPRSKGTGIARCAASSVSRARSPRRPRRGCCRPSRMPPCCV